MSAVRRSKTVVFPNVRSVATSEFNNKLYGPLAHWLHTILYLAAALRHLADAARDLVSLFALLPKASYPSLSDLQDMGFRNEELRQLGQQPINAPR